MTSPNVPAGPGPRPPYGPTGFGGPTPPVQPSPHGVGYTTQVPPPSQSTPPPPYGPGPGPVPHGRHPGPIPHAEASGTAPHTQPSGPVVHGHPPADPVGPSLAGAGPTSTPGPMATLLDVGVTRRSARTLVRWVYPAGVGAGVVLWLGPVVAAFAAAATFGGSSLILLGVLALTLGWIPSVALIGLTRVACETWLHDEAAADRPY